MAVAALVPVVLVGQVIVWLRGSVFSTASNGGSGGANGGDGSVTLTTVSSEAAQTPINNCVTAGTSSAYIPASGTKRLMKPIASRTLASESACAEFVTAVMCWTYRLFCKVRGRRALRLARMPRAHTRKRAVCISRRTAPRCDFE